MQTQEPFNPTHIWCEYVEGKGAKAEPVEVVAGSAYNRGPHHTVKVRAFDGRWSIIRPTYFNLSPITKES